MTSKIKAHDVNGIQINVGDPVMCVDDVHYGLTVGKIYTVESVAARGVVRVVGDNGLVDGWSGRNFRVNAPGRIKAGDVARVAGLENTGDTYGIATDRLTKGDEGEVTAVEDRDDACVIGGCFYHLDDLELVEDEPIKAAGGAVRSIESKFLARGRISTEIRNAFPEAFGDLVTATWKSGDPEEVRDELLRVAEMEGAHVTATRYGATRSGNVHHVERSVRIHLGAISGEVVIDLLLGGWTITVTAPADPTGGDPVVLAAVIYTDKRVIFRAEDGKWSNVRGATAGVWSADSLTKIERLSAQTIAELMSE